MNGKPIHIIFAVCLWLVLTTAAVSYYCWEWLKAPLVLSEEQTSFVIPKGASFITTAQSLNQSGVIRWPKIWQIYARFTNKLNIKAGEYVFAENESPMSLLDKIYQGKVVQYQVTFIEGSTFREMLAVLSSQNKLVHTIDQDIDYAILNKILIENSIAVDHPEGWFFPDTYQFVQGDTDVSILIRAHKKLQFVLAKEWERRDISVPYSSPYEALIMASIVEKETGAASERKEIAGVFTRRLNKKMRLQTDPTVIYGMGERYDGNITRKDLRESTPYNTYVIKGLPPTPIAMPGEAAIHAALNPADGNALFFVAKGDGTHVFSETLEAHQKAVKDYQLNRRSDYRSSPKAVGK